MKGDADLWIEKSYEGTFEEGTIMYVIDYGNSGNSLAENITITDYLGDYLTGLFSNPNRDSISNNEYTRNISSLA